MTRRSLSQHPDVDELPRRGPIDSVTIALLLEATDQASEWVEKVEGTLESLGATTDGIAEQVTGATSEIEAAFESLAGVTQTDVAAFMEVARAAGLADAELDLYAEAIRDAGLQAIGDEQAAQIAKVGEAAGLSAGEIDVLTGKTRELAIAQAEAADAARTEAAAQAEADAANDDASLSMAGVGKAGLVAAAVVAAVAVVSVKSAIDYQSATASLQGQAHLTASAANSVATAFLNTAGKVTFSAQQMMQAYAPVAAQLGQVQGHALSTAQAISVMNAATDLAEASQTSLSSATSALASVMQAYSLDAAQAAGASNQLFNIARDTGSSVDSVAAMVQKLHTQLGAVAPPLDQVGALMVDLANHGETGRGSVSALKSAFTDFLKPAADVVQAQQALKVATDALPPSLKSLAAQVTAGSMSSQAATTAANGLGVVQGALFAKFTSATGAMATANQAQAQMGITAVSASGKLLPLGSIIGQLHTQIAGMTTAQATAKLASDGFGSSASKLVGIVQGGIPSFTKATNAVNQQGAAHKAAQEQAKTFEGQMKTVKATLGDLATTIGNALLPVLDSLMKGLLKILTPVTDFIEKHKTLTAVMLVVVGVLGAVAAAIWVVGTAVGALSVAMDVLAANPIVLIIMAIIAALVLLGVGIYEIVKHWHDIAAAAKAAFDFVKHYVMDAFDFVKGIVMDAVHWIESHWQLLLAILTGPIGIAVGLIATHFDDIKQWASDAVDWIKDHWELLVEILTGPIGWAVGLWQHFHDQIISFFEDILARITAIFEALIALDEHVVEAIIGFFARLPGEIAGFFEQIWSDAVSILSGIINEASHVVDSVVSFFEGLPGRVVSAVSGLLGDMLNFGEQIVHNIVSGIGSVAGDIGSAIEHAIPGVGSIISGISHLAAGGLITSPTLALVGEAGPELVLPLSDLPGGVGALSGGVSSLPAINTGFGGVGGGVGGTTIIVQNNLSGQVYGSLDAMGQAIGKQMATRWLPQASVNIPH